MVDEGLFATTAEVQRKVGANVSATSNVEAFINQYMTEAESLINWTTNNNWSDDFTALNVDVKGLLKMAASAKAAMMVINYDTAGMQSRESAQRLNVLRDEWSLAIKELKVKETEKFAKAIS